jgi:hypothetical protein
VHIELAQEDSPGSLKAADDLGIFGGNAIFE